MSNLSTTLATFQFEGYRIEKSVFIRNAGGIAKSFSIDIQPRGRYFSENNEFELFLSLILKDENSIINIEIEAVGNFKLNEQCSDETMKNFFYVNAPAILFPYIRAYIASLTTLSGYLTPIILPTMNLSGLTSTLEKNTEII